MWQSEVAAFRNEVCMAHSSLIAQRKESERLMIHIHALQCQILSKTAPHESDMIKKKLVSTVSLSPLIVASWEKN